MLKQNSKFHSTVSQRLPMFQKGSRIVYLRLVTKVFIYSSRFSSTIPIDQKYIDDIEFEEAEIVILRPICNKTKNRYM